MDKKVLLIEDYEHHRGALQIISGKFGLFLLHNSHTKTVEVLINRPNRYSAHNVLNFLGMLSGAGYKYKILTMSPKKP